MEQDNTRTKDKFGLGDDVLDDGYINKIKTIFKDFVEDSYAFRLSGENVKFKRLFSEQMNNLIGKIDSEKAFGLAILTKEPNLIVIFGEEKKNEIIAICFEKTIEKKETEIKSLFPGVRIEGIPLKPEKRNEERGEDGK